MVNYVKKTFIAIIDFMVYFYYFFYCKIKKIKNDDIWLISERGVDARDNGYVFYTYLKKNHPEINVKYVISKESSDKKKINSKDIIDWKSKEHYILFITAGKLISTHIMGYSPDIRLFWRMDKKGLLKLNGKRVFLQHGITKNFIDIMQKSFSPVDLFICGAKPEYDYILETFGYEKEDKVVQYTGFARFDNLISTSESNQILIMPTWRLWLNYTNNFKETLYFKRWNNILNNEFLKEYIEKNNITLVFYPHFEIQKYLNCFTKNSDNIIIADFAHYDVQQLLKDSKLLVTDYSSVYFDFAYMNKQSVYYQFDEDEFLKKHYSKGYFDYYTMGFGPVVKEENLLVKKIIDLYEEKENYLERINNFFPVRDFNNCKRIFDLIKKL